MGGTGTITDLDLINGTNGAIDASGSILINEGPGQYFFNSGLVTIDGTGVITVTGHFKNFTPTTGTFAGGRWMVGGLLKFDGANIVINSANFTLAGGRIENQSGLDALASFADNKGTFTLSATSSGGPFLSAGPFIDTGKFTVAHGTTFMVGASGNYNQSAGITTVDGVLEASPGALIDITGGVLEGNGTFSGNVSAGNASGTPATFIIGDSAKKAGSISISNALTLLPTAVMDVQIGGTTPGAQYSQLNVTGQVTLNGTLNLARINRFTPTVGETFTILTSSTGITGIYSAVNGTAINATRHFVLSSTPMSVEVNVVPGP
jgi:hypothetical protein